MEREIEIVEIEKLRPFKGNPKDLSFDDRVKLKEQLKKHGLLKALSVWKKGKTYVVLDGNQRLEVMKELLEEDGGADFGFIRVEPVEVKDEKDAADKCLVLIGQYGRVNKTKLKNFVGKAGYNSLEDAQQVFSFVEMDQVGEGDQEEEDPTKGGAAPDPSKWAGKRVVHSPTDGAFFYVVDHVVKEGFTKEDIWDEQQA